MGSLKVKRSGVVLRPDSSRVFFRPFDPPTRERVLRVIARVVGMTEREARGHGHRILLGKRPMTQVGRAVEKGETQGFIKIVVDADTQRILGAAILGTGGDEAVQCITTTMYTDARYTTLQRTVLIHPTVCELIPTVLGELKEA